MTKKQTDKEEVPILPPDQLTKHNKKHLFPGEGKVGRPVLHRDQLTKRKAQRLPGEGKDFNSAALFDPKELKKSREPSLGDKRFIPVPVDPKVRERLVGLPYYLEGFAEMVGNDMLHLGFDRKTIQKLGGLCWIYYYEEGDEENNGEDIEEDDEDVLLELQEALLDVFEKYFRSIGPLDVNKNRAVLYNDITAAREGLRDLLEISGNFTPEVCARLRRDAKSINVPSYVEPRFFEQNAVRSFLLTAWSMYYGCAASISAIRNEGGPPSKKAEHQLVADLYKTFLQFFDRAVRKSPTMMLTNKKWDKVAYATGWDKFTSEQKEAAKKRYFSVVRAERRKFVVAALQSVQLKVASTAIDRFLRKVEECFPFDLMDSKVCKNKRGTMPM